MRREVRANVRVDARNARRLIVFRVEIKMRLFEPPAVAAMSVVHMGNG